MGRDDSAGKGTNKQSLPQTPKNMKIKPEDVQEEFAKELAELDRSRSKRNRKG